MMGILTIALLIGAVLLAARWRSDRKRWEEQRSAVEKRYEELLRQKEESDAVAESVRQEWERMQGQEREIRKMLQMRDQEAEEKDRQTRERLRTVRASAARMHLYVQLVREQCDTETAQKQCDEIASECEEILRGCRE